MTTVERPGKIKLTLPDAYALNEAQSAVADPSGRARSRAPKTPVDRDLDALFETGELQLIDSFVLDLTDDSTTRASLRSRPDDRALELDVPIPPGWSAAVLLERDGLYTWHVPEPDGDGDADRRRSLPGGSMRFKLDLAAGSDAERRAGKRGFLKDFLVDKVKGYVLRFAAKAFVRGAAALREHYVTTGLVGMGADDPTAWGPLTPEQLAAARPDEGPFRVTLFVHGTCSSTRGSFAALAAKDGMGFVQDMLFPGNLLLGYDHPTLLADPEENAGDLLDRLRTLGPELELDIVAFSRGGLVTRVLTERLLPEEFAKPDGFRPRLNRVFYVGCTNNGTEAARTENWHSFVDLHTNLVITAAKFLAKATQHPAAKLVSEGLQGVTTLVKLLATAATDPKVVPGLAAMSPESDFLNSLNEDPGSSPADEVYVVRSSFEVASLKGPKRPEEMAKTLAGWLADRFTDKLLGADSDLVVDIDSMAALPGEPPLLWDFSGADVFHFRYFEPEHSAHFFMSLMGIGAAPPDAGRMGAIIEESRPRMEEAADVPDMLELLPELDRPSAHTPKNGGGRPAREPAHRADSGGFESMSPDPAGLDALTGDVHRADTGPHLGIEFPATTTAGPAATDPETAGSAHTTGPRRPDTPHPEPSSGAAPPEDSGAENGDDEPRAAPSGARSYTMVAELESATVEVGRAVELPAHISADVIETMYDELVDSGREFTAAPADLLRIQVVPKRGFELTADYADWTGPPPTGDDQLTVTFRVRATRPGTGLILVRVWLGGSIRSFAKLKPEVTAAVQPDERSAEQPASAPGDGAQPDGPRLRVEGSPGEQPLPAPFDRIDISEELKDGRLRLRFELVSTKLLAGATPGPYYSNILATEIVDYVAGIYKAIEGDWSAEHATYDDFHRSLRERGADMFTQLVPEELQRLLWDHRDALAAPGASILLCSSEPWIPWELVHLKEPGKPLDDQDRFLGMMGLVRWNAGPLRGTVWRARKGRVHYIVPEYPEGQDLPEARAEGAWVAGKLDAVPAPAGEKELRELLRAPDKLDLLHYAGHGEAVAKDADNAKLILASRWTGLDTNDPKQRNEYLNVFTVRTGARLRTDGDEPGAVIVLNACQAGRSGRGLTGLGGFAEAFLEAGAEAFVGTLWMVNDTLAREFVEAFYEALLGGATVSEAAVAAREAARVGDEDGKRDPTWLAYVVYGHPFARLQTA